MAQFDFYRNPSGHGFLINIQSDLLDVLATRVVAPLIPTSQLRRYDRHLNPTFDIEGEPHAMMTEFVGAVPNRELGDAVGSLADHRDDIVRAVDALLIGV